MAEPPSDNLKVAAPKFTELNELVTSKVNGKIIFSTDDWFAVAENLLNPADPVFKATEFTEYGKWMDGWESRRKRIPGHDWCIIQLGAPGVIHGIDIDTSFFTGNYTPKASVQAAAITDLPGREGDRMGQGENQQERKLVDKHETQNWEEIVPKSVLNPGYKNTCHNYFAVKSTKCWTHLRLNMFPDGGIARLQVYGQVVLDWAKVSRTETIDLAAMLNGGICVGYSNVHFGHARNMIGPGRSNIMADGWETARRLDRPEILEADENGVLLVPGSEWAAFKLGHPGIIKKIEIDTNHFKGNYPDSCWIEGCYSSDSSTNIPEAKWDSLLPVKKLSAHKQHYYEGKDMNDCGVVSHVRIYMAPDGGISRMRLWGFVKDP